PCAWAQQELPNSLSDTIQGPTFAAAVDLADALRKDDGGRGEIERLVSYLLDAASGNDAQSGVLASALDAMQILQDDVNLSPFKRILAGAVAPQVKNDSGVVVKRGLADAAL